MKCDLCDGWGRFDDIECPRCHGTGLQVGEKPPPPIPPKVTIYITLRFPFLPKPSGAKK